MTNTCLDVYKNLSISMKDGDVYVSPCCLHHPGDKVQTIDFVNNKHLKDIREQVKQNQWPATCTERCLTQEKINNTSRRLGSNQWYKDHKINDTNVDLIRIDYWVGDGCNLACAICGPDFSTSWKKELNLPIVEQKSSVNKQWKNLDLSNLKFIHFNGGEPLLSKEHVNFLTEIPNPNQVHIFYNTNGTVRPTKNLIDLWGTFKLVQLDFSIDDIGKRFEYQRYPANWEEVKENLQWFIDTMPVNCMFGVNTAVGLLNQDTIAELEHWLTENFKTNRVTDPIEHKQQPVDGLLNSNNTDWEKIVEYLDNLDQRRGTSWRHTFPELTQKIQAYSL